MFISNLFTNTSTLFRGGVGIVLLALSISDSIAQADKPIYQKRRGFPAREFIVGPKFGAGAFDLFFPDTKVAHYVLTSHYIGPESYYGGIFARQESKRTYLQLEAVYAYQTDQIVAVNLTPGPFPYDFMIASSLYKFRTLYFPLAGGYRPLHWLRLFAGPYLSIRFNDHWPPEPPAYQETYQIFHSINQSFRTANAGYQAGIGVDIWKFTLDVQYMRSLTAYTKHIIHKGDSYAFRSQAQQLTVTLGFKLLTF